MERRGATPQESKIRRVIAEAAQTTDKPTVSDVHHAGAPLVSVGQRVENESKVEGTGCEGKGVR